MTVWIVSLEWNQAPSEVTDDPGIVSVHATEAGARAAQRAEQRDLHEQGDVVYGYSMGNDAFCVACGERAVRDDGTPHVCPAADPAADAFCPDCGDELTSRGCERDHDGWTIDVHCTVAEVLP